VKVLCLDNQRYSDFAFLKTHKKQAYIKQSETIAVSCSYSVSNPYSTSNPIKTMKVYDSKFLVISYDKQHQTLYMTWSELTENMSDAQFRDEILHYTEVVKEVKPARCLFPFGRIIRIFAVWDITAKNSQKEVLMNRRTVGTFV
jgi:hypothetical protein